MGLFGGRVDFNPGPATYFVNKPNTYQTYIVKLSPDRQFLWVKFYPLHISSYTKNSFILSPDENYFYQAGTFRNTIDVVTIQGHVSLTSNGDSDFCIYKIDMAGDIHFIKQWGSAEFDSYTHMHFDRNQDLVVAGGTSGVLSLDNNTTIIPKRPY